MHASSIADGPFRVHYYIMPDGLSKRCYVCGETKAIGYFYRNASTKDGRQPDCKTCRKASQRVYQPGYRASESGRAARTAYEKTKKGKAARAAFSARPNVREKNRKRSAAKRKTPKYALRAKAWKSVRAAIGRGEMARAVNHPCEDGPGGCDGGHQWHHDSYHEKDWLRVRCLCRSHHQIWHRDYESDFPVA